MLVPWCAEMGRDDTVGPRAPRWAVACKAAVLRRTCLPQDNISSLLLPWAGRPPIAWL
jgi:hypothetical protein